MGLAGLMAASSGKIISKTRMMMSGLCTSAIEKTVVVGDHTLKYSWLRAENLGGQNLTVVNTLPLTQHSVFTGSHGGYRLERLKKLGALVHMNVKLNGFSKTLLMGPFQKIIYINQDVYDVGLRQETIRKVFHQAPELLTEEVVIGGFSHQNPADWDLATISKSVGYELGHEETYTLLEKIEVDSKTTSGQRILRRFNMEDV